MKKLSHRALMKYARLCAVVGAVLIVALLANFYIKSNHAGLSDRAKTESPVIASHHKIEKERVLSERGQSLSTERPTSTASSKNIVADSDLILVGTAVPGHAIFEDKSTKKQSPFKKGESVFNKGVLVAIETSSAKVSIDGEVFTYRLMRGSRPTDMLAIEKNMGVLSERPVNKVAKRTGHNEWELDTEALSSVISDPSSVLSHARLAYYNDEGRVKGFLVSKIKANGIFSKIGLKNGDVLLRFNGYDVTSRLNWPRFHSLIEDRSNLAVELIRAGKPKTLSYRFN